MNNVNEQRRCLHHIPKRLRVVLTTQVLEIRTRTIYVEKFDEEIRV